MFWLHLLAATRKPLCSNIPASVATMGASQVQKSGAMKPRKAASVKALSAERCASNSMTFTVGDSACLGIDERLAGEGSEDTAPSGKGLDMPKSAKDKHGAAEKLTPSIAAKRKKAVETEHGRRAVQKTTKSIYKPLAKDDRIRQVFVRIIPSFHSSG